VTGFAYTLIWGRPLVLYIGILAIVLFLVTAALGKYGRRLRFRGKRLGVRPHRTMAVVALLVAIIHGVLALSPYIR
jgi:hypothetical protein